MPVSPNWAGCLWPGPFFMRAVMCRTLRNSGISDFSFWAVLVLLLASATCSAQQAFMWQGEPPQPLTFFDAPDALSLGTTMAAANEAFGGCSAAATTCASKYQNVACTVSGAPTALGQSGTCTWDVVLINGPGCAPTNNCVGGSGVSHLSAIINSFSCSSFATQCNGATKCAGEIGSAYQSGLSSTSGSAKNKDGCVSVVNPPGSGVCLQVPALGSGWTCAVQLVGGYENDAAGAGQVSANNCVSGPGGVACLQSSGSGAGKCGTFNGDQVCPSALPNNSCVFFQSGGSACTVSGGTVASGAPLNSSGGAAAVTGTVTDGPPGGAGPGATANYYSSTTVVASSNGASGASGGVNVGNGGAGSGSGGTGTQQGTCGSDVSTPCAVTDANASANGDCSSGDCSTAGNGMPTYDWSSDSWSGALTSFWNAVAAGPVGTAVGGISSNWPSGGSCPLETVTISTLQYTADYGSAFCSIWSNSAVPVLSTVMLAVWSILAVLIFLSA